MYTTEGLRLLVTENSTRDPPLKGPSRRGDYGEGWGRCGKLSTPELWVPPLHWTTSSVSSSANRHVHLVCTVLVEGRIVPD